MEAAVHRDHHIPAAGNAPREGRGSRPPFYTVMKYMSPFVLGVITLKYQGRAEGLFETNSIAAWGFILATCVYWLMVEGMDQIQIFTTKWLQIFRRATIASGVFSIVSQVSIFLPRSVSFVLLVVCAALQLVILAWPLLCCSYDSVQKGITSVFDLIRAKMF